MYMKLMEDNGISWNGTLEDEALFLRMVQKYGSEGEYCRSVHKCEREPILPLPEGKFRCIVIDPPWPVEKIEREVRPKQKRQLDYPTMTLEQIESLSVPEKAVDGCHIYLWVTHRFLPDGLRIFEKWGANYECLMTWVKPTGMTPYSWMYDTEHVIFGRIGSLELQKKGLRLSMQESVKRHSQKPDIFYERVIQASPEPRLELFARKKREGFTVWGNEV